MAVPSFSGSGSQSFSRQARRQDFNGHSPIAQLSCCKESNSGLAAKIKRDGSNRLWRKMSVGWGLVYISFKVRVVALGALSLLEARVVDNQYVHAAEISAAYEVR
jgi:hypothetical protein